MIATHNIKVNGRWFRAGEEIPETVKSEPVAEQIEIPVAEKAPAIETPVIEEPEPVKEPTVKRSSSRRKTTK